MNLETHIEDRECSLYFGTEFIVNILGDASIEISSKTNTMAYFVTDPSHARKKHCRVERMRFSVALSIV